MIKLPPNRPSKYWDSKKTKQMEMGSYPVSDLNTNNQLHYGKEIQSARIV